jgi:hypothetical protein
MPRDVKYLEGLNGSGAEIAAYKIVEGSRLAITLAAGVTSIPYGVTARAIADGDFGDVAYEGIVPVLAGTAGMTAGSLVMPEAGGTGLGVDVSGSAGTVKGVLGRCEQAATAGKLGLVRIAISRTQIAD